MVRYYSEVLSEYAKKKKKRRRNLGFWKKSKVWNVQSLILSLNLCFIETDSDVSVFTRCFFFFFFFFL